MDWLDGGQGLLLAVSAQLFLYGLGWLTAGALVQDARDTARHWSLFSLTASLAMLLASGRGRFPDWLAIELGDVLMLGSLCLMRRASELFFGHRPRDREHLLMMALLVGVLVAAHWQDSPALFRAEGVTLMLTLVSVRAVQSAHRPMREEFGPLLTWMLHGPALLFWLLALYRVLDALVRPELQAARMLSGGLSAPLALAILVISAALQFSYAGMLVLRLVRQLRHLSDHDPLTGLLNRRAMDQQLALAWRRLQREPAPLSLVVLDLDHFKRINDQHGHAAGDAVLVALARCLRDTLRPDDVVARSGGEEFLILLPGTDAGEALAVAQRLCERIAGQPLGLPDGRTLSFTASLGVAELQPQDRQADALWARADAALYLAKAEGRNRVCLAPVGS